MNNARNIFSIFALLSLLSVCTQSSASSKDDQVYALPSPLPTYPAIIYTSKYSIRCATESPEHPLSAPIYSFASIDKPDFPQVDKAYLTILRKIYAKMNSDKRNLRFTYSAEHPERDHDFDAFTASQKEACFNQQLDFLTENPIYKYNVTFSSTNAVIDNGDATPFPWPIIGHPQFRRVGRYGIACNIPNTDDYAAASFSASDIGKTGVPSIKRDEREMIKRILRHLPANEIRFTILDKADVVSGMPQGRLVVYQSADDLVCANSYAFPVLNQPVRSKYDPRFGRYAPETMSGMGDAPAFPWNHPATPFPLYENPLLQTGKFRSNP